MSLLDTFAQSHFATVFGVYHPLNLIPDFEDYPDLFSWFRNAPDLPIPPYSFSDVQFYVSQNGERIWGFENYEDQRITIELAGEETTVPRPMIAFLESDPGVDAEFNLINYGSRLTDAHRYFGSVVFAGDGNDRILSAGGHDRVEAGAGNDTLLGRKGNDRFYGEAGNDEIRGNRDNDYLYGGSGDDSIYGGGGSDDIRLGDDDDEGFGGKGDDEILGGAGSDLLVGGHGFSGGNGLGSGYTFVDQLSGDEGNDRLFGDNNRFDLDDRVGDDDVIDGGDGADFILGGGGDDRIYGEAGFDLIWGGGGHDTIDAGDDGGEAYGESGDDVMSAGDGRDTMEGGLGDDVVKGGEGNDSLFGHVEGIDAIESLGFEGRSDDDEIWGEAGNDTLFGGDGRDHLLGGSGNDVLYGGQNPDPVPNDGDNPFGDVLNGGTGDDILYGGDGIDVFQFVDEFGHDEIKDYETNETLQFLVRNGSPIIDERAVTLREGFNDVRLIVDVLNEEGSVTTQSVTIAGVFYDPDTMRLEQQTIASNADYSLVMFGIFRGDFNDWAPAGTDPETGIDVFG